MTRRLLTWICAAGALGLAACGSDSNSSGSAAPGACTPPTTVTTGFREDVYPIFVAQCAACHGDNQTARPKFASIDPTVAYSAARTEIDESNPSGSRLVTIPNGGGGHPDQLSDAQTATVVRWIQQCAPQTRDTTATTTR